MCARFASMRLCATALFVSVAFVTASVQVAGQELTNSQADKTLRAEFIEAQHTALQGLQAKVQSRTNKNLTDYNTGKQVGWEYVNTVCALTNSTSGTTTTVSDDCAAAAIAEVNSDCSLAAKYFKKNTKVWNILGVSMVIASATFTGLGASTALANAKVFSTLGGTTGLGAVTSTINANAAGDQAALVQLNTALQNFEKFVQSGGKEGAAPSNELIWKSAPLVAAQCASAANAGSGNPPK